MQLDLIPLTPKEKNIHETAIARSRGHKQAEYWLLVSAEEVDRARLYEKFRERNAEAYCQKYLDLKENVAWHFVNVAKRGRKFPLMIERIEEGRLTVSVATRICSILTEENHVDWIDKACALSKAKLDRALAAACDAYLENKDPVRKADRAKKREVPTRPTVENGKRTAIPAASEHAVNARDRGACQVRTPGGEICAQTRWVHQHHIVAIADGGTHDPGNLITVCSAHHAQIHAEDLRL